MKADQRTRQTRWRQVAGIGNQRTLGIVLTWARSLSNSYASAITSVSVKASEAVSARQAIAAELPLRVADRHDGRREGYRVLHQSRRETQPR